jgi:hypothetical protein
MKASEIKKQAEENWQSVWREILELPDGSIDVEQLKLELLDYSEMIQRMTSLTCQLTGHVLSYPTYPVETILSVHEEHLAKMREDEEADGNPNPTSK